MGVNDVSSEETAAGATVGEDTTIVPAEVRTEAATELAWSADHSRDDP
ncbi:hypothetical protein [Mycobacterium spongiae]|uniref:Uncharacterized protein n=1 Tax=Mycobacterium spongiae TaxID=886343 RepID=A0A975PXX2_9MYCO|nr:hypothetical protein [Mycobacterium spongiae]QUR68711.1 hypothetical protein F6B93_17965 [Mycobacterium spongiae]